MILRVDGTHAGPAVDARTLPVDATRLVAAVRDPDDPLIDAPTPRAVNEHVGLLAPDTTLRRRTALAAAARSRGAVTEYDAAIRRTLADRDAVAVPAADVPGAVAAVREAGRDVDALRDAVARRGGEAAATDDPDVRAGVRAAAADLAAAETSLHAAEQRLARERGRQRAANDARERRLRLTDRAANLQRAAREALAAAERARFTRARRAVPDWPARDALAVARLARLRAPVVVADGPFRTAAQARACLAAPVVLV